MMTEKTMVMPLVTSLLCIHSRQINVLYVTIIYTCSAGELFAVGSFNTLRLCDKTGVRFSPFDVYSHKR